MNTNIELIMHTVYSYTHYKKVPNGPLWSHTCIHIVLLITQSDIYIQSYIPVLSKLLHANVEDTK